MEEEVVRRRGWLTHDEFLDLIGAANLIPGPNSTEVAVQVGHRVAGWPGLLVAGACFILPATLIVSLLAWAYVVFGQRPSVEGLLYGVKPVVIAVVVQALWNLGRSCVRSWPLAALGLVAAVLAGFGVHEPLVLFGAGLLLALVKALTTRRRQGTASLAFLACPGLPLANAAVAGAAGTPFGLWPLFWFFVKVGSVLFGSGYVLLAFLRADLVERYGWLTERQLLDAVAVGQVTPGPVFTTATFIGYLLGGPTGAAVATVGIFLPAFAFVAVSVPLLPHLRKSAVAGAFLDGVNIASLALMGVVTWQLGRAAVVDVPSALLAAAGVVLLLRWRVNSAWLVLGGAVVGLVRALVFQV
jgi:chromate transporter